MNELQLNLIVKKLSGELSAKEAIEFDSWVNFSNDNQKTFKEFEKIWIHSGNLYPEYTPDMVAEWEKLKTNITTQHSAKIISFPLIRVAKMAAVLISIVLLAFVLKQVWFKEGASAQKLELLAFKTADSAAVFYLPDSSKVVLNKNSEVLYAKQFADTARMTYLKGEGYFEVRKTGKPFIVYAGGMQVRVLGTTFNVKANEEDEHVELVVFEGKVAFSEQNSPPALAIKLQADDKAQFHKKDKNYKREKNKNKNFWWKRFGKGSDIEKELNNAVNKIKRGLRKK
ncbi:MAG: FecR domain-containing protein [Bacteroidetes bacterium]|nr:FecR domain-containing protein [Bacteroidota bacterium]